MPNPTTLSAVCGRKTFKVTSWKQVSTAYRKAIEALNLGASQSPPCLIKDDFGTVVARVSYNGRVWNAHGGLIYDPRQ